MLDWILGRKHEKEVGQRKRLATDRHLLFLHRLEQRALHFGRGAVDLVRQKEIREDRPLLHREIAAPLIVDHRAEKIGRKQVGSELDAMEACVDGAGKGTHGEGLGEPRHTLQQDVPVGEQPDDEPLEHRPLADDDLAELRHELAHETALFLDEGGGRHPGGGGGVGREWFGKSAHGMGMYSGRSTRVASVRQG